MREKLGSGGWVKPELGFFLKYFVLLVCFNLYQHGKKMVKGEDRWCLANPIFSLILGFFLTLQVP